MPQRFVFRVYESISYDYLHSVDAETLEEAEGMVYHETLMDRVCRDEGTQDCLHLSTQTSDIKELMGDEEMEMENKMMRSE